MALRNLSTGKRLTDGLQALDEIRQRAESLLNRYQDGESNPDATHGTGQPAGDSQAASLPKPTETALKTPLQSEENGVGENQIESNAGVTDAPVGEESPKRSGQDAFSASLEALRKALGKPTKSPPTEIQESNRTPAQEIEETDEPGPSPSAEDTQGEDCTGISALEGMPIPRAESAPTPLPQTQQSVEKKPAKKEQKPFNGGAQSIDSALEAVRESFGLVRAAGGRAAQPSTPRPAKRRPLSDGIPKSVSEDLPKYSGKPRMRICNRCGHETKLRNSECQNCGKIDESLGILDAVISGDLAKVEQILLVRPNLITVRTNRHEWTLLHMAASGGNRKMVDLLVQKGASVNALNRDGKTPLHYAAGKGHLAIVEALLDHHADLELKYHGKTAQDLAREHGQFEIEAFLKKQSGEPD